MSVRIGTRYCFKRSNNVTHSSYIAGAAIGSFDGERLIGFGVLAHRFRGKNQDQLQVDLMYVSRALAAS
ncbi:hypothetical protein [Paenibacillus sp. J45TS6]|uniref:hypothetical protein n=1 Tax=Paenibacillus sp. J45TS6 TaxID=2807196 RepID=UPI001BCB6C6A|nr:hypothetical protein [Paenibacillus sp. J45TS6]